jgi:hypothetical protein
VTDPDMATTLRNLKVPKRMTSSQELRDFLLAGIEEGEGSPDGPVQLNQLTELVILSHLEVIDALGALEERIAAAEHNAAQLKKSIRPGGWL